jgi:uncharacterized protein (TIGR00369 family)
MLDRGIGDLATKMGIEIISLSAEKSEAKMPVIGNTQPFGVVHGGAYVVLAESLGSMSANVWAGADSVAVGIEVNATHTRSAREGTVHAVCNAIHLGRSLTTHEVVMTDDEGRRLSTVRITNFIRSR